MNRSSTENLEQVLLTEENGEEAFQFLRDHYIPYEPVNIATESGDDFDRPSVKSLFVPSGVSVGLREPNGKALVGLVLSYTQLRDQKITIVGSRDNSHLGAKRRKILVDHMLQSYNVFCDPEVNKQIYMGYIITATSYRGQGVGVKLTKLFEDVGKSNGCQVATAIALNPSMKKILRNQGYKVVYSLNCQGLVIDGIQIFNDDLLPEEASIEFFVKYL